MTPMLSLFWWIVIILALIIVGVVAVIRAFVSGTKKGVNKYKQHRANR